MTEYVVDNGKAKIVVSEDRIHALILDLCGGGLVTKHTATAMVKLSELSAFGKVEIKGVKIARKENSHE